VDPGLLGFVNGVYLFHHGYWGPQVGFYGGINYGFGYNGIGYEGGRWDGGRFYYNSTVNNFGAARITNVYNQPVVVPPGVSRMSFNGGSGGVQLRPTPEQERFAAQTQAHIQPTALQVNQARLASVNAQQFNSTNRGVPPIAATPRPGEFRGRNIVPARAAGSAEAVPQTGPLGEPQKLENQPKPGQPLNAERPPGGGQLIKPEPLNVPKAQEKLPNQPTAPAFVRPPVPAKPVQPALAPNGPPKELERPQGLPRPVAPGLPNGGPPKGFERPPGGEHPISPMGQPRPEFAPRVPPGGERPIGPIGQPRPEFVPGAPRVPPGAVERNQPRPQGKPERECGKPGLPPCPH
jgi:hypothetical protein